VKEVVEMTTMKDAAAAFLANKRVAVTGVSRHPGHGSNVVYQRLRDGGYQSSPSTRTSTRWRATASITICTRSPEESRRS
jgi:hypothetical protein